MASTPNKPKFLCLFSDGTWNDLEMKTPSNIFRMAHAIKKRTTDGRPVVSFYDPGIGTYGGFLDQIRGGAFGQGIDNNIKQLYTFLAMNYEPGDDICLFGYSRGAYTVRSLAGMIHEMGLLSRTQIHLVDEAYETYRSKDKESTAARDLSSVTPQKVKIKLLVCFDTVGALGIPRGAHFVKMIVDGDRYRFHNTTLSPIIENAIHALAIDEDRRDFTPTYMEPHPDVGPKQVTERFLPGHHAGIGGGDEEEKYCSHIAAQFAIEEIEKRNIGLLFEQSTLPDFEEARREARVTRTGFFSGYNALKIISGGSIREIKSKDALYNFVPVLYKRDKEWRPNALQRFFDQLDSWMDDVDEAAHAVVDTITEVVTGDKEQDSRL